ncbi:uncharacterized protein LOC111345874 isoform X1 [Stylophora pistillata]|uniref:uncharacterized protein LOC111345874 isoform X1 n=1 Tax=Stylophora pistillata TaxID=50429 RepID=UPI000C04F675|nr:uncharacterized protein LOC111345874 isoform X1 [Stylophora pistillata]
MSPQIMLLQIQRSLSFNGSDQTLKNISDQDCFWNNIKKIGHHVLLDPENTRWHPPERTVTWPLKEIIANKERVKERQKQLEAAGNSVGFLGQKPEGVPEDVDDMVRTQVAPVREVYSGAYRRQMAVVTEVDNFEGVLPGSIVAVNLEGNCKPPHLAKVKEVTNSFFTVQWLKGTYKGKWVSYGLDQRKCNLF